MLEYSNPGIVTRLDAEGDGSFLYLFIALNAAIQGWNYCKPTLVVDGTFLKAIYRGEMLTAVTQDGQGRQIIPTGYSIVDSKNDASWEWFFECLKEIYPQRDGMCIVSDRHQSIAKAAGSVYTAVPQSLIECNNLIKELDVVDPRIKSYLKDVEYHKWAWSHCSANRTTTMTSNIVESVNASNKYARELPVIDLQDFMTNMVQRWDYTNGNAAKFENITLTNKYEALLKDSKIEQTMAVRYCNDLHIL
ncbi:uncharacterized protein LOC129875706 [Solanum dulcamara]|uniref:uncharacterized protein LOC129875706 n=1 Tax=Solanum dulcamara TaxID=45834 RepID=UPI00248633D9|nr:uncharacterized protein LOC129875706 [Solanum dulcamara]